MGRWISGWENEWVMGGWKDGGGWIGGWMEGWRDGWLVGGWRGTWMGGLTSGRV